MAKFHELQVKEVRRETPESVSVALDVPASLKDDFQFTQGQYLTFKQEINGEEVRRSYSICTSPFEDELRVAIKQVEDGRFSTFANHTLKAGDALETMTPMGSFYTELDEANEKHYVAFAVGSGITPILSILKAVMAKEPKSRFSLIYGNKSFSSIIFREEIEALKNTYLGRLAVHHVLSREDLGVDLNFGRITADKCKHFCSTILDAESIDEAFLCGPFDMIMSVSQTLQDLGMEKKHVHFELFATPDQLKGRKEAAKDDKTVSAAVSDVTVVIDGNRVQFPLEASGDTILDAAHQNGLDVPYACKGGVCNTCKAKLLEGKVEMDVNYALEAEEVEAGFILTCQSHPRTDKVVVDFDDI